MTAEPGRHAGRYHRRPRWSGPGSLTGPSVGPGGGHRGARRRRGRPADHRRPPRATTGRRSRPPARRRARSCGWSAGGGGSTRRERVVLTNPGANTVTADVTVLGLVGDPSVGQRPERRGPAARSHQPARRRPRRPRDHARRPRRRLRRRPDRSARGQLGRRRHRTRCRRRGAGCRPVERAGRARGLPGRPGSASGRGSRYRGDGRPGPRPDQGRPVALPDDGVVRVPGGARPARSTSARWPRRRVRDPGPRRPPGRRGRHGRAPAQGDRPVGLRLDHVDRRRSPSWPVPRSPPVPPRRR